MPRQTIDAALEHRAIRVRGVAEPGVRPRAEGDRDALVARARPRDGAARTRTGRGRCRARSASRRCVSVAVADVVGGPRADRLPVVVPGAELFEERAERAVAMPRELELLGHLGQVGRERQPARRRLVVEPARRAVGGVRAEPRPGAGGDLRLGADRREPVPGLVRWSRARASVAGRSARRRRRRATGAAATASQLRPAVVVSASSVVPAAMLAARFRADRLAQRRRRAARAAARSRGGASRSRPRSRSGSRCRSRHPRAPRARGACAR